MIKVWIHRIYRHTGIQVLQGPPQPMTQPALVGAPAIDLNWFRKKITKKDLEDRDFAWGYSSTKGYYIGYKMTLVVEYPRLRPVYFCLHRGSPNDARLFLEILKELKRRRILRSGDKVITDNRY